MTKIMNKNLRKAFSLVELSIVILVIGILVAAITKGGDLYRDTKLVAAKTVTQSSIVNSIEGLMLWLETTSSDSFGNKNINDGDKVSQWNDINPQSTQKSKVECVANCASYVRDAINGLPALRFRNPTIDGYYKVTFSDVGIDSYNSFFVVAKTISQTRNYLFDNFSGVQYTLIINTDNSAGFRFQLHGGKSIFSGANTAKNDENYIVTAIANRANSILRYNGNEATGDISNNSMSNVIKIGKSILTDAKNIEYLDGYIAEFIVFNRILTRKEFESVEKYLSQKWNIDL